MAVGPACAQPGCPGRIDDGYCDACGLAPAPPPIVEPGVPEKIASGALHQPTSGTTTAATPTVESAPAPRLTAATRPVPAVPVTGRARASRVLARPVLGVLDPLSALVEGSVPEHRRFCSSCEDPLRAERGFCPRCRQEYSFVPTLRAGELLGGRYEIKGTLAFGGLGWIYLALDVVLGRWVTLKGLLNAHDPKLIEVAVQEREYLAAVKHPNIVSIYDFLTHGREGFIVMEYVNGKSLTALRREAGGPLPVAEALAYLGEALPALAYLDEQGLVYCDFKPDNVMIEQDSLKLIDLGAVRRADDTGGDIYGSRGYSAPEAAERPTHRSDLYSAARTLALLVASFDYQGKYEHELPPPSECEVFRQQPALYALLRKATARDPVQRFGSAGELAEQVTGVLRLVAGPDATPAAPSRYFELSDGWIIDDPARDTSLPPLRLDESDEGASLARAVSGVGDPARRRELLLRGLRVHPRSSELKLRLIDEHLTLREWGEAERRLNEVSGVRARWYQGRRALLESRTSDALAAFRAVADELPGELGPLLALARTHEAAGQDREAVERYGQVLRADPSSIAAAFGLSRCHQRLGAHGAALDALRAVPPSSRHYLTARLALAGQLLQGEPPAPRVDDVLAAAEILEALEGRLDNLEIALLRAETLAAAARQAARGEVRGGTVLGAPFDERSLRRAAERAYHHGASLAGDPALCALLIDEANAVRPWSLF